MLPPPFPITDEMRLADWLELSALISDDANSSIGDLERVLRREEVADEEDIDLEDKYSTVIDELEKRSAAAPEAYPFVINETRVEFRGTIDQKLPYIFCLLLSYIDWEERGDEKSSPEQTFEELSCVAVREYTGGEVVRFAAPRNDLPAEFDEAVEELCELINEGEGYGERDFRAGQDKKLDVVAWKSFPDQMYSKLVVFGQCASGKNWLRKAYELDPVQFCRMYMRELPSSRLIRSLFIPHRITDALWFEVQSGLRGLLFERCRIGQLAYDREFRGREQALEWAQQMINQLKNP
jgi:hypothetical protein